MAGGVGGRGAGAFVEFPIADEAVVDREVVVVVARGEAGEAAGAVVQNGAGGGGGEVAEILDGFVAFQLQRSAAFDGSAVGQLEVVTG